MLLNNKFKQSYGTYALHILLCNYQVIFDTERIVEKLVNAL